MTAAAFPARFNPRPAPLTTVDPTEHRQTLASRHGIACPRCGKVYAAGAVVSSAPEHVRNYRLANYTGHMVTRRLFCDHEHLIICWDQACQLAGANAILGDELGTYSLIRDRATIDKFLRDHPEAAGVAQ